MAAMQEVFADPAFSRRGHRAISISAKSAIFDQQPVATRHLATRATKTTRRRMHRNNRRLELLTATDDVFATLNDGMIT